MSRRATVCAALAASAALAALAAWGCATTATEGPRLERPGDPEPDGGWAAYRPPRRDYDVEPMTGAMGSPSITPIAPLRRN